MIHIIHVTDEKIYDTERKGKYSTVMSM